jgi:hypothetical protein
MVTRWICGPAISCHGLNIGFRASRDDLFRGLADVFPPGSCDCDADVDILYSLDVDCYGTQYTASAGFARNALDSLGASRRIVASNLGGMLKLLRLHLQHTVAELAAGRVFVHAAAIAWRDRLLLFPGRSRSGKSVLAREFIRAGAVYFSDEFAAVDEKGMVHPFARPILLRSDCGKVAYDPGEHGHPVGAAASPAGLIVITRYARHGVFRPTPVPPGQALLYLARNTVSLRSNPGYVLRILTRLVSSARAVKSARGEASDAVAVLLNTVESLEPKRRIHGHLSPGTNWADH